MTQDDLYINGDLLRLRREARGWVVADMATRACMSVKQIRQLEEGGTSAFYSSAVKLTAAKKVATLLGISHEEVFAPTQTIKSESAVAASIEASEESNASSLPEIPSKPITSVPLTTSQASEVVDEVKTTDEVSTDGATKSKTSWLTVVALFVLALVAAAYFQPKPEVVVEPPPPVQAIPPEPTDPASAASAAEAMASEASVATSAPAVVQAPASVARTAALPSSAPLATRAASSVASAAASAASK